jgi:hypothetical protein
VAWSGIVTSPSNLRFDSRLGNPDWVDNWTVGSGLRMEFIDARGHPGTGTVSFVDLPNGWTLRTAELTSDLIAVIPNPSKVAILGDGSGFHGPLPISQLESACR